MESGTQSNVGSPEWLATIRNHLIAGRVRLQTPPPSPAPLEAAAHHAIGHLVEIEKELKKGSPLIAANAGRLRKLYQDRLIGLGHLDDALRQQTNDDTLYARLAALVTPAAAPAATAVPPVTMPVPAAPVGVAAPAPVPAPVAGPAPVAAPAAANPQAAVSGHPLFSRISQEYIDMRIAADGADHKDVQYLKLRRQTFLALIDDRPVDKYTGKDLQDYINAMKFWPANVTKRTAAQALSVREILAMNQDRHLAPLTQKTMMDGYLANVKTMIRSGMTTYGYQDPFAGVRLHWPTGPQGYAPSVTREGIDDDVLNGTFRLGVASGLLDSTAMPLLLALTTRRLGLLCFLRGQDIRRKFNVWIAQTAGIVFDQGVWRRVPIKTADSATFFVLHEKLSEIGFVDWARAQRGYVFEAIHEYKDPAKSTSKNLNRLMRDAGARGGVEVLHCLRGDGIDEMREQQIDGRDRRLQAGHALGGDEHDNYGFRALGAAACRRLARASRATGRSQALSTGFSNACRRRASDRWRSDRRLRPPEFFPGCLAPSTIWCAAVPAEAMLDRSSTWSQTVGVAQKALCACRMPCAQ